MKLNEDFKQMSPYEKWKLRVDFMRFIATMLAPFMMVALGYFTKYVLKW
jgi:hypothetical protein